MFEKDYIDFLRDNHSDTLGTIKSGVINDEVTAVLEKAAAEITVRYSTK